MAPGNRLYQIVFDDRCDLIEITLPTAEVNCHPFGQCQLRYRTPDAPFRYCYVIKAATEDEAISYAARQTRAAIIRGIQPGDLYE